MIQQWEQKELKRWVLCIWERELHKEWRANTTYQEGSTAEEGYCQSMKQLWESGCWRNGLGRPWKVAPRAEIPTPAWCRSSRGQGTLVWSLEAMVLGPQKPPLLKPLEGRETAGGLDSKHLQSEMQRFLAVTCLSQQLSSWENRESPGQRHFPTSRSLRESPVWRDTSMDRDWQPRVE